MTSDPPPTSDLRPLASVLVFAGLWAMLIDYLRIDWEINPQYSYGWLVPLFSAYIFWKRWPSRPEVGGRRAGKEDGGQRSEVGGRRAGMEEDSDDQLPTSVRRPPTADLRLPTSDFRPPTSFLLPLLAGILALSLLPTRWIRESSPDWSVVRWAMALEVVALTLVAFAMMGGWRTARHFAWPICFFLVAVPWPSGFETQLTQTLMQRVATATAEIVGLAGYMAESQGNLIRLSTGVVGVDEACSGVRSLQSMFMASLLLGEVYRFKVGARLVLVAGGLLLALFFNLVRALTLVTIAIGWGLPTLEKWHDAAGMTILVLSFAALAGIVRLFRSQSLPEPPPTGVHGRMALPMGWAIGLALWLGLTELSTALWYRSHESNVPIGAEWDVRFPVERNKFKEIPISDTVRKTLAYNEGRNASWEQSDGTQWQMFFFKWAPGRTSSQAARVHRPEICLPATGCALVRQRDGVVVQAGDLEIPFQAYVFNYRGRPLHVFFCLWETGNKDIENSALSQEWSAKGRLQRVLAGQRNRGQQSMEVVVTGIESEQEAEAAFRQGLEIRRGDVGGR